MPTAAQDASQASVTAETPVSQLMQLAVEPVERPASAALSETAARNGDTGK
jgi:hypothetical protein